MITIHKYKLRQFAGQEIETYENVNFIDLQWQYDDIVIWAIVDTSKPRQTIMIFPINTGEEIKFDIDSCLYLGSHMYEDGIVKHFFAKEK